MASFGLREPLCEWVEFESRDGRSDATETVRPSSTLLITCLDVPCRFRKSRSRLDGAIGGAEPYE